MIKDYEVPIQMIKLNILERELKEYDSKLFKILSEIEGVKCVRRIADDLKMDINQLKNSLKNLLDHGLI